VQRVQGKERRHGKGPPQGPGHAAQHHEQEQGVGTVEQHVDEVVHARVRPEERHVEHVRQPGERVPVGGVAGEREGPPDGFEGEA